MDQNTKAYNILLIEDNPGDILIFEEHLEEYLKIFQLSIALNLKEAKKILKSKVMFFDIIFMDLNLPDGHGDELIEIILKLSKGVPIILLTGFVDLPFSVSVIKKGVYDYLLKYDLTGFSLYKSIQHNLDRRTFIKEKEVSAKRYMDLFQLSPQPILVFDKKTLEIKEVNTAAISTYGYSKQEFLSMSMNDIKHKDDIGLLFEVTQEKEDEKKYLRNGYKGTFRHVTKNGNVLHVEVFTNFLAAKNQKISVIYDVSESVIYTNEIESQNKKLREIAWIQSHIVRAPLARMMGLIDALDIDQNEETEDNKFYLDKIVESAKELDIIINEISKKTISLNESAAYNN